MSGRGRRFLATLLLSSMTAVAGLAGATGAHAHPPGDAPAPQAERFQKVVLEDSDLTQPMRIAVAPDGRVVYIERDGRVKVWDPEAEDTVTAGSVPVRVTGELGMVGLELAPDFAESGHLYLHFSPTNWDTTYVSRVSRFTLSDDNVLDLSSETKIIDIQHPIGVGGGHSAGDLLMTDDGQLFIATGDNTNCCASNGFPGTDERPGHADGDAQRTSANTNDLNGKVLRIIPKPGGGYDIPEGNLFPEAEDPGDKTRPEIYAMGFRNPFTLGDWDPITGTLWMADYGPDAVQPSEERGPAGHVRAFLIEEPGFYGWPYCTMNNVPYNDWDYVNDRPGAWFDCENPVNDSPNNTGLVDLPPIKPATVYYTYETQDYFPQLYGGGAMAGPRYNYDENSDSPTKFPEWFDHRRFLYDWTTDWVRTVQFDHATGEPRDFTEFLPDGDFRKPMDMEFGTDGSLYVLDYGNGWGASNDDSSLYRIDYVQGNRAPEVHTELSADSGPLPLTVEFDASRSSDPDDDELTYSWDFDGDGAEDATGPRARWTFTEAGEHTPRVTVTDANGKSSVGNFTVVAGNTRPTVTIDAPVDGTWAEFGEPLPFRVEVTDPEDGEIDCTKVRITYQLGHNQHGHPQGEATPGPDCTGILQPDRDAGHGPNAYVFHIVGAEYTDAGGADGAPSLTGSADVLLHPRVYQGRNYPAGEGVGLYYGQLFVPDAGNWFSFPQINVADIDHLNMEFATREPGVSLDVHAGSPTGPVVASFDNVPDTGSTSVNDREYKWFSAPVTDPGGVHDLYFVADWPENVQPELFVRFFQFQTVPEVNATLDPAAPSGQNGWYTTEVAVDVTAEGGAAAQPPLWNRQYSIDGGTTWNEADARITLDADGEHEVRYRAVDAAGVTSKARSLTVKIDRTAPTVQLSGAIDGADYLDSATLELHAEASDDLSGITSATVTVDGTEVPRSGLVELWRLPLGEHRVVVTATDNAGNTDIEEMEFHTATSISAVGALIDQFAESGQLSERGAHQLTVKLAVASRHGEAGRHDQAVRAMEAFKRVVQDTRNVSDPALRTLLLRDADAVIHQFS